jgi:hypothetical protein
MRLEVQSLAFGISVLLNTGPLSFCKEGAVLIVQQDICTFQQTVNRACNLLGKGFSVYEFETSAVQGSSI